MMKKLSLLLLSSLVLVGCISRDRPVRIITNTVIEYRIIPESYFNCPPPPVTKDETILLMEKEADYNQTLTLPLFDNNSACYEADRRIYEWNEESKRLNEIEKQRKDDD